MSNTARVRRPVAALTTARQLSPLQSTRPSTVNFARSPKPKRLQNQHWPLPRGQRRVLVCQIHAQETDQLSAQDKEKELAAKKAKLDKLQGQLLKQMETRKNLHSKLLNKIKQEQRDLPSVVPEPYSPPNRPEPPPPAPPPPPAATAAPVDTPPEPRAPPPPRMPPQPYRPPSSRPKPSTAPPPPPPPQRRPPPPPPPPPAPPPPVAAAVPVETPPAPPPPTPLHKPAAVKASPLHAPPPAPRPKPPTRKPLKPEPVPEPPVENPAAPLAGENVMNVVMVASECAPWSKTGGLGDVVGALPKALAVRGHRVMVVVPRYGNYEGVERIGEEQTFGVAGQDMRVSYFHTYRDGVDYVFLDHQVFHHVKDSIYAGDRLEIGQRCALLCRGALEAVWHVPCGGVPYGDSNTVFIANDWQTALLPVYLQAFYRDHDKMMYARCILVIHNLAHQGRGPLDELEKFDIPENYSEQFYLDDPFGGECMNIFKAGLLSCHRVVTVSHGYAWEVQTDMGGWGLAPVLQEFSWKLSGIVNGIDYQEWSPENDEFLLEDGYTQYPSTMEGLLEGKVQCKAALQRQLGLKEDPDACLLGFIGRLDEQKGVDLITDAKDWLLGQNVQLVMLGSGRADLEESLRDMENQHRDKCRCWVGFSVAMAHRITAGCDLLLMPSRFEPCGLNQLYAQRYGTVPVVHAVGGLRDTVENYDPYANAGTGWSFDSCETNKLIEALGHALTTYRDFKDSFRAMQVRCMDKDSTWDHAAELYEKVLVEAKYQW